MKWTRDNDNDAHIHYEMKKKKMRSQKKKYRSFGYFKGVRYTLAQYSLVDCSFAHIFCFVSDVHRCRCLVRLYLDDVVICAQSLVLNRTKAGLQTQMSALCGVFIYLFI